MDINEFMQRVQPRKKRSRLIPFSEQIRALKKQGYTDLQIRGWLAENGVMVSREAVRKFIKNAAISGSHQQTEMINTLASTKTKSPTGDANDSIINSGLSQAEKIRLKLEDQQRDAQSRRFTHDKTGNHT